MLIHKTKQFFLVLIKFSIVVSAFYFIYQKLVNNNDLEFSIFIGFLMKKGVFLSKTVVFLVFLSIFNWFFEVLKWKTLVDFIRKISFKNALEQSLGSLTASLFTPNRIGEYGAKAIYYTSNYQKQIVLINLLSNILQMTVTVILGIVGITFFVLENNIDINYSKLSLLTITLITITILIVFGVTKSNFKIKGFSLNKIKLYVKAYPRKKILLGFIFSAIRYLIFSFQFYYLLQVFGANINYLNAMKAITSMYILASIIPSIFIFDVVIKGSIAVYLFAFLNINELVILSIITIMWLLNFVIPSIFGSYFVLNFKLPKQEVLL
ncbi:MAG: hypothetical protein NWQ07_05580 [Flaviramulus sp.]|nr:hypothetical protein [Flaviramulus sp.]